MQLKCGVVWLLGWIAICQCKIKIEVDNITKTAKSLY